MAEGMAIPIDKLSDAEVLALTMYGEARGETFEGILAVGSVILQRVKLNHWFGKGVKGVCLKPYQFSCYNQNDPNFPKLIKIANDISACKDSKFALCLGLAESLLDGSVQPNITAAYYKVIGCKASWEAGMEKVASIGHHEFFREPAKLKQEA